MLQLLALTVLLVGAGLGGYLLFGSDSSDAEAPVVDDAPQPMPDADVPDADPTPLPEPEPVVDEPAPEPPPEPVIPQTVAAVRERAQERYLTATQAELRDLSPIPDVWPSGPYLAAPSEYPEVLDVWQSYRSTIRQLRSGDVDRYRQAYVSALDDAAIVDDSREARLDAGIEAFAESAEPREAHFDRVEGLATAAIQSHNALVEAEGMILYDRTGAGSEQLGAGVSGRDSESQLLLDQVVELLEGVLDAEGEGPESPENVRAWVWDGLLDAVAR